MPVLVRAAESSWCGRYPLSLTPVVLGHSRGLCVIINPPCMRRTVTVVGSVHVRVSVLSRISPLECLLS